MKATIYTFVLLFSSLIIFAQQKQVNTKSAIKPAVPISMNAKDTLLAQAWKVISYDRFSVVSIPDEKQKNDGVTFMLDGTAFLTVDGIAKTGIWTTDKPKTWITLSFDGGEKRRLKIMTLTKDQLVYEYQDQELVRTIYNCEPLKKK